MLLAGTQVARGESESLLSQQVVLFNRGMLPAYYGILRMCCEQSPAFTRQLASHQNIQWAFKNLTPHASQYPGVGGLTDSVPLCIMGRLPDLTGCWCVLSVCVTVRLSFFPLLLRQATCASVILPVSMTPQAIH